MYKEFLTPPTFIMDNEEHPQRNVLCAANQIWYKILTKNLVIGIEDYKNRIEWYRRLYNYY